MIKNLSIVINTYNEEKNIVDCIKSVKEIAGEIIVVDMKSADRTRVLAKESGAKVYTIKQYGYVEPARNFAISKATGNWILLLDADERVSAMLRQKIKSTIDQDRSDVIEIPRKNIIFGKWIKHTFWWPDYQVRLFKKGKVKWFDAIHKQPEISGQINRFEAIEKNAIEHRNIKWYKDADGLFDMIKTYAKLTDFKTSILNKNDLSPVDLLNYMSGEFKFRFIQNKGYMDKMHGFILSKFMEFYRFAEIVYFWEKKGYPDMFENTALKEAAEKALNSEADSVLVRLEKIENSKFYKIWRFYCGLKDFLKRKY